MPATSISQGEAVYVRAYSTKRSAIAQIISVLRQSDGEWGRVRLMTDWYDWDGATADAGLSPQAGEVLQLETFRLEAIRQ
jgi:hypothetical protein